MLYRQHLRTPKVRSRLKFLLFRCNVCRRVRGKTVPKPLPPPLPKERVQWKEPFTTVGVDHTFHLWYRDKSGTRKKVYICLFVCAMMRVVHLEPITDLSTPSFLLCLRRLTAAKEAPLTILSDNHRTFISGERFLLELQDDHQVKEYLASRRIEWRHQTPPSPWMGGHYERLVRTIKVCLSTAIARKLFNYEEFVTVIREVENIINSRPLTYQGTDTLDIPLSPSQLVWG